METIIAIGMIILFTLMYLVLMYLIIKDNINIFKEIDKITSYIAWDRIKNYRNANKQIKLYNININRNISYIIFITLLYIVIIGLIIKYNF